MQMNIIVTERLAFIYFYLLSISRNQLRFAFLLIVKSITAAIHFIRFIQRNPTQEQSLSFVINHLDENKGVLLTIQRSLLL